MSKLTLKTKTLLYYYEFSVILSARAQPALTRCSPQQAGRAHLKALSLSLSRLNIQRCQKNSNLNICQLNLNNSRLMLISHLASVTSVSPLQNLSAKMANSNQDFLADSQVPGSEMPWTGM